MKMILKSGCVSVFAPLMCWVSLSSAQEVGSPLSDIPPPDEMRFISVDDATSKCIGNPKTPLCAVETFLACGARQNLKFCQQVGVYGFSYSDKPYTSRYRVLDAKILTEADMTPTLKDVNWWKPGFVNFTLFEYFSEDGICPDECRFSYIANPVGDEWHVMDWSWWGEQDPDDPGPESIK